MSDVFVSTKEFNFDEMLTQNQTTLMTDTDIMEEWRCHATHPVVLVLATEMPVSDNVIEFFIHTSG